MTDRREAAKAIMAKLIVPDYRHDPTRWAQESPLSTEQLEELIVDAMREREAVALEETMVRWDKFCKDSPTVTYGREFVSIWLSNEAKRRPRC